MQVPDPAPGLILIIALRIGKELYRGPNRPIEIGS
jgi:hypothetical protein